MAKLPHTATSTTAPVAYPDDHHTSQRQSSPPTQPPPARQSSTDKHQIVWQMAHELRIPLTAMLGFAQMLINPESSKPLDPQQRGYVTQILAAGDHLLQVINELLEIATARAGHLPIERAPIAPRALLAEARDQLAPLASAKSQRMTLRAPDTLPTVKVDHVRMRQVLLNLLGNAIQFAPVGSEITLGAQPASDGAVDFFVHNRGTVIPRADQRLIFQPFARGPQPPSDAPHGAGLGLAIAQELVQSHGGTIWVRSSQRHGTTFWVRLPR
ncbi:MAG: HAMP domain-containing histidine kinase [Ktedonobacterales bacterium]|nr:HAMP domain-containing histidine kinase [Ktedonobacterales bacterium]